MSVISSRKQQQKNDEEGDEGNVRVWPCRWSRQASLSAAINMSFASIRNSGFFLERSWFLASVRSCVILKRQRKISRRRHHFACHVILSQTKERQRLHYSFSFFFSPCFFHFFLLLFHPNHFIRHSIFITVFLFIFYFFNDY